MTHATPHALRDITSARPSPYVFERRLRSPAAHRCAEAAWSLYPPVALLLAALLLAGGCRKGADAGTRAHAGRPAPSIGASQDSAITSASSPVSYPGYPVETPLVGAADARATAHYGKNRLEIANLSEQPWPATWVWVNHRYGALLPYTRPGELRSMRFEMLRDERGRPFPSDNLSVRVEAVELVTGDERTSVPFGLGY